MEQTITIRTANGEVESQTDMSHLRDIEFSILFNMYKSKELFNVITNQINANDFTFLVNKKIFEYLVFLNKEENFFGDDSKKTKIAINIFDIYNISPATTLKILDGRTKHCESIYDFIDEKKEENLDVDIFEILDFSKKRQELISEEELYYSNISIEDEYGFYDIAYCNGMVKEVGTSYIFHLPKELCDTYRYTFENIIYYVQTDNYEVNLIINEDDPEDVKALSLKKNISKIEQIEKLIQWADENEIDNAKLPRNRGALLQYSITEEFDKCNLDNIPSELFEIKKNSFSFNFLDNKIKTIPANISDSECSMLMLCHNKISVFPKSVYELKELSTLCLHGNKIKSLPEDIDQIKKLKHLSISNNPVAKLPQSISKIDTLKELDIENTFIDEESLELLELEKIEKISFDDRLLPYFIKNFKRLKNIDTINLVHSDYKEEDELVKNLSLKNDYENWIEDKDYQGHGCIVLSKSNKDNI